MRKIPEEVQTFFFLRKIHGVHAWFSGFTRGGLNFVILVQITQYTCMVYFIPEEVQTLFFLRKIHGIHGI